MADPEIEAMTSVANALIGIDVDAQARVVRWAAERFGVVLGAVNGSPGSAGHQVVNGVSSQVEQEEDLVAEAPRFEHFAELFAKAQPKSDADKALVAAYWVQVIQGKDQWASRLLNAELKHLGHSLSNVTQALTTCIKKQPQLVIQLKKSGSTQQAPKTYKVTTEGIAYVGAMLSSGDA